MRIWRVLVLALQSKVRPTSLPGDHQAPSSAPHHGERGVVWRGQGVHRDMPLQLSPVTPHKKSHWNRLTAPIPGSGSLNFDGRAQQAALLCPRESMPPFASQPNQLQESHLASVQNSTLMTRETQRCGSKAASNSTWRHPPRRREYPSEAVRHLPSVSSLISS